MISYKRDVLERQRLSELKMGRGSPICERVCKKIVEYFKNNVPQRQIAKALQISSSTVHSIVKRFRETGKISVRKGQGWRLLLDARGLWALRRHCITHRHDSVIDITKWAQEYFQKSLSVTQSTMPSADAKSNSIMQKGIHKWTWSRSTVESFKIDCFKVEKYSMVRQVQIWHSCWNSRMSCHPGKRGGRPSSVLSAFSSKLSISDCMGVHKCIRYGQLAWFGRHYECWKVYKGFRTTYAPLQMTSISGRALCILPGQCKPHTAAITAAWLHSIKVRVLNLPYLQSRSFHL